MANVDELIRKLVNKGVDVAELLLDALSVVDPQEGIRERIRLAEEYLEEARQYVDKGDAVQASGKAYKAAEEVIKALAEKFNTPEYQEFVKVGRWYTYLLGMASKTLANRLGYWVVDGWNAAYDLHVWGFHERKYSVEYVKIGIARVEELVREARKVLQ
ncbi:PaREP1 family protein [Vulcanisaeta sp. JCM 14467]